MNKPRIGTRDRPSYEPPALLCKVGNAHHFAKLHVLREDQVFQVASAYEQTTDWHMQSPKL